MRKLLKKILLDTGTYILGSLILFMLDIVSWIETGTIPDTTFLWLWCATGFYSLPVFLGYFKFCDEPDGTSGFKQIMYDNLAMYVSGIALFFLINMDDHIAYKMFYFVFMALSIACIRLSINGGWKLKQT